MKKVISLADEANNNNFTSSEMTLRDALDDLKSGKRKCTKMVILMLDDSDNKYTTGFYAAKIKCSEMVALCSRYVHIFNEMLDDS